MFNYFIASGYGSYKQDSFDTRIDFSPASTVPNLRPLQPGLFQRRRARFVRCAEGVGFGPGGLSGSSITHNYSLASGVTKTFSSTLLANFRFGYFKYNPVCIKPDVGATPMTKIEIPNANLTGSQALQTSGWGGFILNQTPSSSSGDGGNFGAATVTWGDGARCRAL